MASVRNSIYRTFSNVKFYSGDNIYEPSNAFIRNFYVNCLPCPTGYEYFPHTTKCYKYFNNSETILSALSSCDKEGGILPSVHDDETNNFLTSYASESVRFWLGGFISSNGSLSWGEESKSNYSSWANNYPTSESESIFLYSRNGSWYNTPMAITTTTIFGSTTKFILASYICQLEPEYQSNSSSVGFIMAGGQTNQTIKFSGYYNTETGRYCNLPPLDPNRIGHTVTGLTACGGWTSSKSNVSTTCSTFNTTTGQWEESHEYTPGRRYHSAWKTSEGILLMGGYYASDAANTTTLILPDGGHRQGFNLVELSDGSCAIEDPETNSVILTGGYYYDNKGSYLNSVIRYNESGFVEYLPSLTSPRFLHGCGGYYNNDGNLVFKCVFWS